MARLSLPYCAGLCMHCSGKKKGSVVVHTAHCESSHVWYTPLPSELHSTR